MKTKLEQVQGIIFDLKKELPEQMTAFQNFLAASEKPSHRRSGIRDRASVDPSTRRIEGRS